MTKSYSELIRLPTFDERYDYLRIGGVLGRETFGFDRYMNQTLYRSFEWRDIRNQVILRDNGCDLAIPDRQIYTRITIHHINPITIEDIETRADLIFDLDNLISTSHSTHNAIHYGDAAMLPRLPKERRKGDTVPWKAYSHP